jgi:hypothetical protein
LAGASGDTVPQRLLRTVQIGAPQGLTFAQIKKLAADQNTPYTTAMLARSALLVLHQDDPGLIPYNELLDGVLNHLLRDGNAFQPPPGLPDFRGKETVFAMVYAMVMSGQQEQAVSLLGPHLASGSQYKQAVVLSALRNIGTPSAIGLIQQYAERGPDRNVGENALADEDYPSLADIYSRWGLVPPERRTQDSLRAMVQSGCNERAVMAAYWLGFFPPNIDPNKEAAELQSLEAIFRTNNGNCEMMEHVIALKSLGLRTAKSPGYWKRLAAQTSNVWEQHQIVINAWGRWGAKFAPAALDLLGTVPAQYVQWELLNGNLDTRMGEKYRTYWDIWLPANILLVQREDELLRPARYGAPPMDETNLNTLLAWLESGERPRDPWVFNHLLYHLAPLVSGDDTFRLLGLFNALPQRNDNWWIVQSLRDPAALPLLDYWVTLPAPANQQQMLKNTIATLERSAAQTRATTKSTACCGPSEECLRQQLSAAAIAALGSTIPPSAGAPSATAAVSPSSGTNVLAPSSAANTAGTAGATNPSAIGARDALGPSAAGPASASLEIHSEGEARASLAHKVAPPAAFSIRFADDLKRDAIVCRPGAPEQHWRYLYDCWRRTDDAPASTSAGAAGHDGKAGSFGAR